MAYSANLHDINTRRIEAWMQQAHNLYLDAGTLDDVYTNETASGTDPAWVDTAKATAAEYVQAIVMMRRLRDAFAMDGQTDNITSADQTANFTPFLNVSP